MAMQKPEQVTLEVAVWRGGADGGIWDGADSGGGGGDQDDRWASLDQAPSGVAAGRD